MEDKWSERLNRDRIMFEVANRALITITWVSLCIVVCTMFIRGYFTPSPALVAMPYGRVIYLALTSFAVLISVITSSALLWSMRRTVRELQRDIDEGRLIYGLMFALISPAFYYSLALFVVMLISVLSYQVLVSIGEVTPRQRVLLEDPWNDRPQHQTEKPNGR